MILNWKVYFDSFFFCECSFTDSNWFADDELKKLTDDYDEAIKNNIDLRSECDELKSRMNQIPQPNAQISILENDLVQKGMFNGLSVFFYGQKEYLLLRFVVFEIGELHKELSKTKEENNKLLKNLNDSKLMSNDQSNTILSQEGNSFYNNFGI